MSDCLFCRVVENAVPSYTVYEDGFTRAFLDIMPSVPGHVLVILKKHGATILDYTPEELTYLMGTVQIVLKALEKTFGTKVYTIGINHGEPSGVHHLHVHLLPRFSDDRGDIIQSIVHKEPEEDLKTITEKIKKNINA